MSLKTNICLIGLFIGFVVLLVSGQPRKCYQCNSFYDKGCADFFDNRTYPLIPCKDNVTMCRKIIQETFYEDHWDVRYIRQCAVHGDVGPADGRWCKERSGGYGTRFKICQCDNKDGCNGATHPGSFSSYTVIVVPLLIMLFGYFKQSNN